MKHVLRHALLHRALLALPLASVATAQHQTWIRQFGTSGADGAQAAAPDGSGGVYVSGETSGSLGGPHAGGWESDVWLARYDSAGNQTWIRQFGSSDRDMVYAAAPDGSGGVYVGGSTTGSLGAPHTGNWGADVWLAHYDNAGNQTWIRQFAMSSDNRIYAAAPDGSGGVYVSGFTQGAWGLGYDAWLARYDTAGNQTWFRRIVGSNHFDEATACAPDGSGGVYVSGLTWASNSMPGPVYGEAWLAHYDNLGNQTWFRRLVTYDFDSANAVAPDGSGGVYVTGYTVGSLGGPNLGYGDAWLAHYDGAGNQTWIRQFGSSGDDSAGTAASDGSGGVYVSGVTDGSLGGPTAGSYDAWLAHYDNAGNRAWIRQLGSIVHDRVLGAAPDAWGGVYVSGFTYGSLGGPSAGGPDVWLAHYDDDLTTSTYCTPAIPNSTGFPGTLTATGSNDVQANNVTLIASGLSLHSFGYFLTSATQGLLTNPGGSQGNFCLGGQVGRYIGQGQIMSSGTTGSISLAVDLQQHPTPTGFVAVQPGQTWNFQAWYRDANPSSTSNFTDAVSVSFQ
jgi:hypothetical protein